MKVTYSNSYDRTAGYAVEVEATETKLTISVYYEAGSSPEPAEELDGESVNQAWAGKKVVRYSSIVLLLDEVRATPSWQDRSVWTGSGRFLPDLLLPAVKHTKLWHNITAETAISKVRPTDHFMRQMRTSPMDLGAFLLYVPFRDSNFTECALHILSKIDGIPHLVNGVPLAGPETVPMDAQMTFMPRIQISGPTGIPADGKALLNLQLTDAFGAPLNRDCDVYLDCIGGYLPQPRVKLVNGVAQARVMALGLEPGESFKVKAGFKFWSGDSEITIGVM